MNILLLEDDIVFSEMIEEFLLSLNHNVEVVYDYQSAAETLYNYKFDLLLLDIDLPDGNSLDLLNIIRKNGLTTPAIMVTSFTNVSFLKRAYDFGCNDYIKKPFEFEELKSRISYIEKTYKINFKGLIKIEEHILLDPFNMKIIKSDRSIKVPKKEVEIIRYFLLHKNRVISIEELILNVWEFDKEPSIATIRTYIKNIRRLIRDEFLESIKGVGYRHNSTF